MIEYLYLPHTKLQLYQSINIYLLTGHINWLYQFSWKVGIYTLVVCYLNQSKQLLVILTR